MSSVPSGSARPSFLCSRAATHAPPVWMPIITGWCANSGFNASAMRPSASSTDGSSGAGLKGLVPVVVQERLENGLRGEPVEVPLVLLRGDTGIVEIALGRERGQAFVHHM